MVTMPVVNSGDAAAMIRTGTGFPGADTAFIRTLCATGILTDHGSGRHVRLDFGELTRFIAEHPYRPVLPFAYLRVSVGPLEEAPAKELTPPFRMFRTHAGYDHRNTAGLSPEQRAYAIVANWRLGLDGAQDVVDRGLPVLGCIKGVVTPDTIYWPTAVVPLFGGFGFRVDPDRRGHPEIPTGAILDVPRGNMFRLVPAGISP